MNAMSFANCFELVAFVVIFLLQLVGVLIQLKIPKNIPTNTHTSASQTAVIM